MAKLTFSVDSALLSELGEKLVESVHIALLELVKNSYDADATHATVKMLPEDDGYEIHVEDNGTGMAFSDVENYWMRIATTNKADEHITDRFGRIKSGSKGIGRFSCRRLGSALKLKSTAELEDGRFETTTLTINWDDYEPGSDVDEIECEGHKSRTKDGKTGTTLVITGANPDDWSQQGWRVLKRRLVLLVSNRGAKRRGYERDPGFNVSLIAPDFEEDKVVDQREQLMDAGWGRLSLTVNKKGEATWELDAKRIGHKQLVLPDACPDLAGTTADIAILPHRKDQFRSPRAVGMVEFSSVLKEWGGVHIRKDGIRVHPYGEGRNDWLFIDRDRGTRAGSSKYTPVSALAEKLRGVDATRALLNLLSAHQYVGEVCVESPTNLFEMKASREGFVGERGIELLANVVRTGIDWSTIYRDYYIRQEQEAEAKKAKEEFESAVTTPTRAQSVVEDAVNYVQKEFELVAEALPTEERRQVMENVSRATTAVLKTTKLQQEELRHLRLVASTSSLLLIFSHEVKSLLGVLDEYDMRVRVFADKLTGKLADQAKEMQSSFKSTKERFLDLLGMTSLLAVDSRTADPKRLTIRPRATKAANCFDLVKNSYKIDIDVSGIPNSLQTPKMLEAELYSVLLNVLSNSIKSVIARGREKSIAIKAKRISAGLKINVLDTGMGVPDDCEDLFDPFIADPKGTLYAKLKKNLNPEDSYVVGTSSGLGLSIIREIVETHEGKIKFASASGKWRCNLEIVLP